MPQGGEEDRNVSADAPDPTSDDQFMRRAIALAMKGRGGVEPNPMVGCVIVKEGRIIGEGFHQRFGGPHAERNALAACTESPAGATAYVTLEPCCHSGKKTPPCAPRLIEARLKRVVIGCIDPNPLVKGGGAAKLAGAGVEVHAGVLEAQARQLIAPFFAQWREARPYVTLKWAQTADAAVAGPGGKQLRISSAASTRAVHLLRAACDAIVVGLRTVLIDDPLLTARGIPNERRLMRCVLDGQLRIPNTSHLVQSARDGPVCVFCSDQTYCSSQWRVAELQALGVEVYPLPCNSDGSLSLWHLVRKLPPGPQGLRASHLLVEPGPMLARSFLRLGIADRLWEFRSPVRIDDASAPRAAPIPDDAWRSIEEVKLDGDTLTEYLNSQSPVFFAPEASADLVRVRQWEKLDDGNKNAGPAGHG
jgi:diaminohydroxyphosphoribosylaminopyrimidine deaminase/5-amino-6-(5-phosphoribosylamino)uracil reductase